MELAITLENIKPCVYMLEKTKECSKLLYDKKTRSFLENMKGESNQIIWTKEDKQKLSDESSKLKQKQLEFENIKKSIDEAAENLPIKQSAYDKAKIIKEFTESLYNESKDELSAKKVELEVTHEMINTLFAKLNSKAELYGEPVNQDLIDAILETNNAFSKLKNLSNKDNGEFNVLSISLQFNNFYINSDLATEKSFSAPKFKEPPSSFSGDAPKIKVSDEDFMKLLKAEKRKAGRLDKEIDSLIKQLLLREEVLNIKTKQYTNVEQELNALKNEKENLDKEALTLNNDIASTENEVAALALRQQQFEAGEMLTAISVYREKELEKLRELAGDFFEADYQGSKHQEMHTYEIPEFQAMYG